tara:strand:+ start:1731 stop:3032 length:1302 start_codon:yes stop_codon:yes gene_type:complete
MEINMNNLKELSELAWQGKLDTKFEHHPVHTFYEGSTELAEDLLGIKGIAGMYVVDTKDGLVMLDTGSQLDIDSAYLHIKKWRPDEVVKAAIYTHHHVDHVFAIQKFDEEAVKLNRKKPIVYSHQLLPDHFDRYKKTLGWNTAINRRQFAINVPHFNWPERYRYPDVTYDKELNFKVGNCSFELFHDRGETDDHTWVFIPERKILATGDLFIWAVPNGGNPQKVQRYISDWSEALDKMIKKEAEIMIPGHGFPIYGQDRIHEALSTTSEFLRDIENQTLNLMNKGKSLNEVYHQVQISSEILKKPWLKPVYDDPKFLIRMIWRRYGGWWDGEYDRLLPDTRENEAKEWVELSGGLDNIIKKALINLESQKFSLATHLIEVAYYADKNNEEVHLAREKIYSAISQVQDSSMARNIFNHASLASSEKKRDLASED